MSEKQSSFECTIICWGVAAVVGVVSMVMLYMLAGFDGTQAFFTGAVIGFALGVVLSLFMCRGQTAAADLASDAKPAQRYAREAAEDKARREGGTAPSGGTDGPAAAAPAATSTSASATAAPVMSGGVKPSKPLAGQAELASRKGEWKYEGGKGNTVEKSKAIPAGETAAPAVAPSEEAQQAAKAPKDSGAKSKRAPVAADGKPELYDAPPAEGADDLKLISGVGPKLEQTLNEMGVYRFEQVAAWRKKEIEWVDSRLRFKGRIERDDWMSQAKILAKGGETEFSKRKKK